MNGFAESRPPIDAELAAARDAMTWETAYIPLTHDSIHTIRASADPGVSRRLVEEAGLEITDMEIPGFENAPIAVSIVREPGRTGTGPGILHTHGGGMIFGDRLGGVLTFREWIRRYNAVLVTVEYRLAPEHPDPIPVEDAYAGLVWTAAHAEELGIEPGRLIVAGGSAGGGLAAGIALLARDRKGPPLLAQVLMCPMLDDRDATPSTLQMDGTGGWDRAANLVGWGALLGDRRGSDDVSIYAAPARATDLSGVPPAYIDCGTSEVFRDEDVAYASAIWAAGGQADLHVWSGGFHGFEWFAEVSLSRQAVAARDGWIERILGAPRLPDAAAGDGVAAEV